MKNYLKELKDFFNDFLKIAILAGCIALVITIIVYIMIICLNLFSYLGIVIGTIIIAFFIFNILYFFIKEDK